VEVALCCSATLETRDLGGGAGAMEWGRYEDLGGVLPRRLVHYRCRTCRSYGYLCVTPLVRSVHLSRG
jgi:LRP1 type putative zinc finger protein